VNDEGADDENFRGSIAWLSGSLPTYHDVGCPSPRKARFQVLVRLSWAGFHPQSSAKRFSTHILFVSSSSKLLGTITFFSPTFFSPLLACFASPVFPV
jgi:hypothetical protein